MAKQQTGARSRSDKFMSLQSRTETFQNFQMKGDQTAYQTWPHTTPSAETMAKLGFYYQPTKRLKDRVKCFCCNKLQSTWKNATDPASHHLKKHPGCWFSEMNTYMAQRAKSPDFDWGRAAMFGDPLIQEATDTRISSFGESWPFDALGGAVPTSRTMVDAGFYYSPQEEDDDLAMCIYCGISLEGWEQDDDPLVEHKKRAQEKGCYFLEALEKATHVKQVTKRLSSELGVEETRNKRLRKTVENITMESQDSSGFFRRPRSKRKAAQNLHLSEDIGSEEDEEEIEREKTGEDKQEEEDDDESFGISAHDLELNSEEAQYESSQLSYRRGKSASTTARNSSKPNSSKMIVSPLKKSKILDSSFSDNDLFSKKNIEKVSVSPMNPTLHTKKPPLNDITNISSYKRPSNDSKIKRKKYTEDDSGSDGFEDASEEVVLENESVDNVINPGGSNTSRISESPGTFSTKQIDTVSSESQSIEKAHSLISQGQKVADEEQSVHESSKEESETQKSNATEEPSEATKDEAKDEDISRDEGDNSDNDSIILVSNSKEIILDPTSKFLSSSSPLTHPSPSKSKRSRKGSPLKNLQSDASSKSSLVKANDLSKSMDVSKIPSYKSDETQSQVSNKSILSQQRFIQSPGIKRSRSPFLDANDFEGFDEIIPESAPIIKNNIALEESTNQNIINLPKNPTAENAVFSSSLSSLISHKTTQKALSNNGSRPSPTSTMISNDSFNGIQEQSTPSKPQFKQGYANPAWTGTDHDAIFRKFADLETAKEYIHELSELPYELSDDIDGRVSYFINEMPEDEVEMTIGQWLKYTASQGRSHFQTICESMLKSYDDECDRAYELLNSLPVEG